MTAGSDLVAQDQFFQQIQRRDRLGANDFAAPVVIDVRPESGHAAISLGGIVAQSFQRDDLEVGMNLRIKGTWPDRLMRF